MKVIQAYPEDFSWIEERAEPVLTSKAKAIKAVDASGKIRGMVVYDNWTYNSVEAHMAVDTPIAWRSLLPVAFTYPMEIAGRDIVLGIIPAHNERSLAMTRHLGFIEVHRIRDGWAHGEDLVVMEMRKENCRYVRHPESEAQDG